MRVVTLSCLLVVVLISTNLLDIELPLVPLCSVMIGLTAISAWTWWRMQQPRPASDLMLFTQLLVDICALSVMLYFSGGATNPFVSFYLPAVAVAAALLPWHQALFLSVLAIGAYSLLTSYFVPLHIGDADRAISYHLAGMWANFSFSAALITWFVAVLSRTVRQRDAQLAQARERYLESDRLASLGIQAANAAHEMGTPLSTMSIIAGDLRAESESASNTALQAYRDDFATIEAQILLCKTALDRMGKQTVLGISGEAVSATQWFKLFADEWRLRYPSVQFKLVMPDEDFTIAASVSLAQILTTLLDNAAQAIANTGKAITLQLQTTARHILIDVIDDGPGIAPALLPHLGYEPLKQSANGRGIGLFLAFATARQIDATIELTQVPAGGTCARLKIPVK
jgi:two-component system sensor histidine kinase RegB